MRQLLQESAQYYLDRKSFSNIEDVVSFLGKLGLTTDALDEYFSSLAELMQQRHRIVHNVDLPNDLGAGPQAWSQIERKRVVTWSAMAVAFANHLVLTCAERYAPDFASEYREPFQRAKAQWNKWRTPQPPAGSA